MRIYPGASVRLCSDRLASGHKYNCHVMIFVGHIAAWFDTIMTWICFVRFPPP